MSALGLLSTYGLSRGASPEPPGGGGLIQAIENPVNYPFDVRNVFGWEFTVGASALTARGLRLRSPTTGMRTLYTWRVSDAALLASTPITVTTADTWEEALFGAPVTLEAGKTYVIGVHNGGSAYYRTEVSADDMTLDPRVTFVTGRRSSSSALSMPTVALPGYAYGLVDVLV